MANKKKGDNTVKSKKSTAKNSKAEKQEDRKQRTPNKKSFQAPRGMEDIFGEKQKYWNVLQSTFEEICSTFNIKRIMPAVVEDSSLFARSIGEETDIVEKEMFYVKAKGRSLGLALRPEFTAGVARAYLEHGMSSWQQPVRLWYFGPVFRHNRPQAGRYRQLYQFGVEIIGEGGPIVDAQVIHVAHDMYKSLQIEAYRLEINSIGCLEKTCRPAYIELLKKHFKENSRKLCADCKRRMKVNPLRVMDCKEEKCQMVANTAPKITEHLCEECAEHYKLVLKYLDEMGIPYRENPRLVRGLDYYTRTVFEFVSSLPEGSSVSGQAIGSGGRYDGLIELLGGSATPAVGFAGGVERTVLQMRDEGIEINVQDAPELFIVHLGEMGRKKALKLFDDLRQAGFRVGEAFHREGIKAQLRAADRKHIPWSLILGQKEALDGTVILRNMESGIQETIDMKEEVLLPALKKHLRKEDTEV